MENRNLYWIVRNDGIQDFDKTYFLRYMMTKEEPIDYRMKVHFAKRLVSQQRHFEEG